MKNLKFFPKLEEFIQSLDFKSIREERKNLSQPLVKYIQEKQNISQIVQLNFICTHNSRRSQLAQIWAKTAADHYGIKARCYSGGVEVTAFNERAVESIRKSGFKVETNNSHNPHYSVFSSDDAKPIKTWSKLFNDPESPSSGFAAIMTCSDADANCPFIPGAEIRISLPYQDPKKFDGTPEETFKYDERSRQIATEMFYVFSLIK